MNYLKKQAAKGSIVTSYSDWKANINYALLIIYSFVKLLELHRIQLLARSFKYRKERPAPFLSLCLVGLNSPSTPASTSKMNNNKQLKFRSTSDCYVHQPAELTQLPGIMHGSGLCLTSWCCPFPF